MSKRDTPLLAWACVAILAAAGLGLAVVAYRPDRPVATIVPGSSSGPAFVVQVIRPRVGLPLGGILPPQLFGLEAHLGFDSTSAGATIGSVGPARLELGADDWELVLVLDGDGRVAPETQVVFELMFEERLRGVRCRPGDQTVGTFSTTALAESGELSGSFDIELARCEDADTGAPLGWPSEPLILHGSFDRLPPDNGANSDEVSCEGAVDRDLQALGRIEATITEGFEAHAPGWSIRPAQTPQPTGPNKFYLVSRDGEELAVFINVFASESSARTGHVHPVPAGHRHLDWSDGTALISNTKCISMSFSDGVSRAFPFIFVEQRVVVTIGVPGESYDYMLPIAEIIRDSVRRVTSHGG